MNGQTVRRPIEISRWPGARFDWCLTCRIDPMPSLIHSQVSVEFRRLEIVCEEGSPVTFEDAPQLFPVTADLFRRNSDPIEMAHELCDILRDGCELQGSHEHLFLLLYFS